MVMLGSHIVGDLEIKVLDYLNTNGKTDYYVLCQRLNIPRSGIFSLLMFLRNKRLVEDCGGEQAGITPHGTQILDMALQERGCQHVC